MVMSAALLFPLPRRFEAEMGSGVEGRARQLCPFEACRGGGGGGKHKPGHISPDLVHGWRYCRGCVSSLSLSLSHPTPRPALSSSHAGAFRVVMGETSPLEELGRKVLLRRWAAGMMGHPGFCKRFCMHRANMQKRRSLYRCLSVHVCKIRVHAWE